MTATTAGAASKCLTDWEQIDWSVAERHVFRLQVRIAKAIREKRFGKAKALQRILTHSFYAKLLAVKRVTSNKGAKTPGVDGIKWKTPKQKMSAAMSLRWKGYKTSPLRRIYIPKFHGKRRPLSIPVMKCRAMQALHLMSLEPVTETLADHKSFGFRPKRSAADAIQHCFSVLSRKIAPQWVLEGDIKSCFDKISHDWLLESTLMPKRILRKWLKADYIERGRKFCTTKGTPQGGIISPTLLVHTLTGLNAAIKNAVRTEDKVNFVIYADDFIVTNKSKAVLEKKVKPAIEEFLKERGLELSQEKTKLTHIDEGFDFLGQNIRKYDGKLLIKPSKASVNRFLRNLKLEIKKRRTIKTEAMISFLRPKIRGWGNYHRHVVSKDIFSYVDQEIFRKIWSWARRRHPNKSCTWVKQKYYRRRGMRDWIFTVQLKDKHTGKLYDYDLLNLSAIPIRRHTKVKGAANPYDPQCFVYFEKRKRITGSTSMALSEA